MHGIEPPTAGDYAYAAAQDAARDAAAALKLERSNRERLDVLARRQRHLELMTGNKTRIDDAIQQEDEERNRIQYLEKYVHPSMIGGAEIPEGWEPTIEGGNLVFRKKEQ